VNDPGGVLFGIGPNRQGALPGKQAATTQTLHSYAAPTITLTLNRLTEFLERNMTEPMSTLSPEKLNAHSDSIIIGDDDMAFNEPPSSPFLSHVDQDDQENIAPNAARTPAKPLLDFEDDVPQSAFRVLPEKRFGLKERASPTKTSPVKNLMDDFEEAVLNTSAGSQPGSKKGSPVKEMAMDRPGSAMSSRSHKSQSLSQSSRAPSAESTQRIPTSEEQKPQLLASPLKRPTSSHKQPALRDNEGLTVAMNYMENTRTESRETLTRQRSREHDDLDLGFDNTDFNPDGPDVTSIDFDDTCFSTFSEMPGMDMTKFASLKKSPTKAAPDVRTAIDVERLQC
jgi:hypothetical protein